MGSYTSTQRALLLSFVYVWRHIGEEGGETESVQGGGEMQCSFCVKCVPGLCDYLCLCKCC